MTIKTAPRCIKVVFDKNGKCQKMNCVGYYIFNQLKFLWLLSRIFLIKLGGTTCIGFKFGNHLHKLQIKPPLDGAICIVPNLTIRSYKFSLQVAPLAFDPKVTRWRHLHFQVEILLVYFLLTVSPLQAIHFILLTFHNCLKLRLTRLQIT